MEITRNVPAPWELESFFYPADSSAPGFCVRVSMSQSAQGHLQLSCVYGPSPNDPVTDRP